MEFLVTGGAGFIGSNLVRRLVGDGSRVRVLDDLSTGRQVNLEGLEESVEFIEGSILDDDLLRKSVKKVKAVFHIAALPSVIRSVEDPGLTHRINADGTLGVLVAARDAGVERFVFSSSSSVYGDTEALPKREDMLPRPLSPYAAQKLMGEHYCDMFKKLYGMETFALRYFNVFGPRQDPKSDYAAVIPLFIGALREGKAPTIFGDGEQTRDFTYVDNVVSANVRCLSAGSDAAGDVYNVACGDRITVNVMARSLAAMMGKEIEPRYEDARLGDVRDSQADSEKALKKLGWKPEVDFQEGLKRTVDYFLNQEC